VIGISQEQYRAALYNHPRTARAFDEETYRKAIANGLSDCGLVARLRSEGRSEDYIAGYVEGRR
jgi:hypothetical protein